MRYHMIFKDIFMKVRSYARIHQSKECLSSLGEIRYRSLFGGYSLTVGNVVFAMVSEGELYLRACEQTEVYFVKKAPEPLLYNKRGRTIELNYYRVDEGLWSDQQKLLELSTDALHSAQREKSRQKSQQRLKDLPNLTHSLEMMLWERLAELHQSVRQTRLHSGERGSFGIIRLCENFLIAFGIRYKSTPFKSISRQSRYLLIRCQRRDYTRIGEAAHGLCGAASLLSSQLSFFR